MLSLNLAFSFLLLAVGDGPASVASATIDLSRSAAAGDPQAPVTIVEYACARCPFCARLTPELHDAVTTGPLKGKAKLYLRVFPLKNHSGAKEAAMAFEAAADLDAFWPYVLFAFRHFEEFAIDKRADWAAKVGLDPQAFAARLNDAKLVDRLVASKKEGIANGVDGTPTLYINSRKYDGKNTLADIVRAAESLASASSPR
jgi:protein-disulfide isomerase